MKAVQTREEKKMKVLVNGQEKTLTQTEKLKDFIEQFCNDHRYVIAEVNGEIIKNRHWDQTTLKNGDIIELVNFVGGG